MIKMGCYLLLAVLAAELSQRRTNGFKDPRRKDRIFHTILAVGLILFAGLRTRYNDTITYIGGYIDPADTPTLNVRFQETSWLFDLGENPGFKFFNSLLKTLGADYHVFIMVYAAICVGISLWFIQKYTDDYSFSVFRYFTSGYLFAFAGVKQATSTAIALIAVDAALEKKWGKYFFFLALATLFHPYALLFLVVPFFLDKKPWSGSTWAILGIFGAMGALFPLTARLLSVLVGIVGNDFTEEEILHGGVNAPRFLTYAACILLFFLFRKILYKDSTREENLFFYLTLFGSGFMFLALFGNQILIGRLPSYFSAYMALSLTYACDKISRTKGNRMVKPLVILCYLAFFVYEDLILKPFWSRYQAITLLEFLESLFRIGA